MLPVELRADLAPLEELLQRRQQEEHASLVAGLNSDRYRRLVRDWPRFLARKIPAREKPADATRPAVEVAAARIRRAYRRVLKRGRLAQETQAARDLHELRLECKKLRYLLEFFASLFDPKGIHLLVRELKNLQDNLGDINDLEVQQESLESYAKELARERGSSERTLVALGRLVERLAVERIREQRGFDARFSRFADKNNQAHVKKLFGKRGTGA
jgi:CHAD domain-containing protein